MHWYYLNIALFIKQYGQIHTHSFWNQNVFGQTPFRITAGKRSLAVVKAFVTARKPC